MTYTPWRLLLVILALTVGSAVLTYLNTPRGLPVLLFGFVTWCGGLVVEALLRKRAER